MKKWMSLWMIVMMLFFQGCFFGGEGEERILSGRTMAEFQDLGELPVKISPFQKVIHPTHTVFQFTVENLSTETITFMGGTVIYEDEDGQPVKGMVGPLVSEENIKGLESIALQVMVEAEGIASGRWILEEIIYDKVLDEHRSFKGKWVHENYEAEVEGYKEGGTKALEEAPLGRGEERNLPLSYDLHKLQNGKLLLVLRNHGQAVMDHVTAKVTYSGDVSQELYFLGLGPGEVSYGFFGGEETAEVEVSTVSVALAEKEMPSLIFLKDAVRILEISEGAFKALEVTLQNEGEETLTMVKIFGLYYEGDQMVGAISRHLTDVAKGEQRVFILDAPMAKDRTMATFDRYELLVVEAYGEK